MILADLDASKRPHGEIAVRSLGLADDLERLIVRWLGLEGEPKSKLQLTRCACPY
jgi:hypothetical protein